MSLEGHFYTAANKLLDQDKLVENFISGADKRVKDLEVSQKKFVRLILDSIVDNKSL